MDHISSTFNKSAAHRVFKTENMAAVSNLVAMGQKAPSRHAATTRKSKLNIGGCGRYDEYLLLTVLLLRFFKLPCRLSPT